MLTQIASAIAICASLVLASQGQSMAREGDQPKLHNSRTNGGVVVEIEKQGRAGSSLGGGSGRSGAGSGSGRASAESVGSDSLGGIGVNGCRANVQAPEGTDLDRIMDLCLGTGNDPDRRPGRSRPRVVDAGVLAERARDQLTLVRPQVRTAPKTPGQTVVGLPTWLWLPGHQWKTLTAKASVSTATVRVLARPVQVTWDMGEETTICAGPGRAWKPALGPHATTTCRYTYQRTSRTEPGKHYPISARIQYDVRWICSGNCSVGAGTLGTVDSPTTRDRMSVIELTPVLIK